MLGMECARGAWRRARRRPVRAQRRPFFLEPLEDRCVPAINIVIDYSLDTSNFFDTQAKRDLMQQAANAFGTQILDSLLAIQATGGDEWSAEFTNPANGNTQSIANLVVPANTLIMFAGGRNVSALGQGGPGGFSASGSPDWLDIVSARGQTGALATVPTDFGPWGGSITFDTVLEAGDFWHFDATTTGLDTNEHDFFSVAIHEMAHALGFGTADSWFALISGGAFGGAKSVAEFDSGGNVPLAPPDGSHWLDGTTDGGEETAMDPTLTIGTRKLFKPLDWAGLDDVGWQFTAAPISSGIANVVVSEDAADTVINLFTAFSDADHTDDQLVFSIQNNSNPTLFTSTTINGVAGTLTLNYAPNAAGTASLTIRATDPDGLFVDTAFGVTITAVNDAPLLDNTGSPFFTAIDEDATSNPGTLISLMILSAFPPDRITDVDSGALEGIAVIAADTTSGSWEFTLDNGATFSPLGVPSASAARLLAANSDTRLRFIPNANFNGIVSSAIEFRAWDRSSGANGIAVNITAIGGASAFSTGTETASITVNAVNDAPEASGIVDVHVPLDAPDTVINLQSNFQDFEDGDNLSFAVVGNLAPALFTSVSINNSTDELTLDYAPDKTGKARITIRATDTQGAFTDATFEVNINRRYDLVGRIAQNGQWWSALSTGTSSTNMFWGQWASNVTWADVRSGDFDGDGRDDVIGRFAAAGQWWVARNTGNGSTNVLWGSWSPNATWVDVQIADVNNDGRDDIVGRDLPTGQWWAAISSNNGSTNQLWGGWSPSVTWTDVRTADVNNDGREDIVGRLVQNGQWWGAISTGNSSANRLLGGWSTAPNWVDVRVGDVNADGRSDIVGRFAQVGQWWAAVSNGTTLANQQMGTFSPSFTWVDAQLGDVNGDGRSDIVARMAQTGQWWVGVSNGTTFANQFWGGWSTAVTWVDVRLADLNADGRADLIGRLSQNGQWWAGMSNGSTAFVNQLWGTWSPNVTWTDVQLAHLNDQTDLAVPFGAVESGSATTPIKTQSATSPVVGETAAALAGEGDGAHEQATDATLAAVDAARAAHTVQQPLDPSMVDLAFSSIRSRSIVGGATDESALEFWLV